LYKEEGSAAGKLQPNSISSTKGICRKLRHIALVTNRSVVQFNDGVYRKNVIKNMSKQSIHLLGAKVVRGAKAKYY